MPLSKGEKCLSKEEERQLIQKAQKGDYQAQDKLVIAHLGLIKSIAIKICQKWECWDMFEDLVHEGVVAFIGVIKRFDLNKKGTRLATFGYPRVKGAMLNFLENQTPVRIPSSLRNLARKVERVQEKLIQKYGRKLTVEEIAQKVGVLIQKVEEALGLLELSIASLDELMHPTQEGEGAWEPISEEPLPEEEVLRKEGKEVLRNQLYAVLQTLRPEWRKVVCEHVVFGKTFKEIAQDMEKPVGTVKGWHNRAIKKLQGLLETAGEITQ